MPVLQAQRIKKVESQEKEEEMTKVNPELIKLMEELKPLTPNERLEILLEAARILGYTELVVAICDRLEMIEEYQ